MIDANALIGALPRMLSGDELMRALKVMPEYDPGVCDRDEAMRLMKLTAYGLTKITEAVYRDGGACADKAAYGFLDEIRELAGMCR